MYGIICISESWLSDNISSNEILSYGYNIYRSDRGSRGGGVLIAITNTIPSNHINNSAPSEMCVVKLAFPSPLLICCVSLSPSSDVPRSVEISKFFRSLSRYNQLIIVGDFNLPDINWNSLSASSPVSSSFCDTISLLNLVQLVDEATHSCGNILDLVLTTIPDSIHNFMLIT